MVSFPTIVPLEPQIHWSVQPKQQGCWYHSLELLLSCSLLWVPLKVNKQPFTSLDTLEKQYCQEQKMLTLKPKGVYQSLCFFPSGRRYKVQ